MIRKCALAALFVVLALVMSGCGATGTTHEFVLVAGESAGAAVLPAELHIRAGDALQIRNNDQVPRQIGALTLRPGEVLTQRFPGPGHFEYSCSVHSGGRFAVIVDRR